MRQGAFRLRPTPKNASTDGSHADFETFSRALAIQLEQKLHAYTETHGPAVIIPAGAEQLARAIISVTSLLATAIALATFMFLVAIIFHMFPIMFRTRPARRGLDVMIGAIICWVILVLT